MGLKQTLVSFLWTILIKLDMASLHSARSQCCCCAVGVFAAILGIFMLSAGICIVVNADFMEVDTSGLPPELHNDSGKRVVGIILICVAVFSMGVSGTVSILYFTLCNRKPVTNASSNASHTGSSSLGSRQNTGGSVSLNGIPNGSQPVLISHKLRHSDRPNSRESSKSGSMTSVRSSSNWRGVPTPEASGSSPTTSARPPHHSRKRHKKNHHLRQGRHHQRLPTHTEEDAESAAAKSHIDLGDTTSQTGSMDGLIAQSSFISETGSRPVGSSTPVSQSPLVKSGGGSMRRSAQRRNSAGGGSLPPVILIENYNVTPVTEDRAGINGTAPSNDEFVEAAFTNAGPRYSFQSGDSRGSEVERDLDVQSVDTLDKDLDDTSSNQFTNTQDFINTQDMISELGDTQDNSALKSHSPHNSSMSSASSSSAHGQDAARHDPYIIRVKSSPNSNVNIFEGDDLQTSVTINDSQFMQDSAYLHDSDSFVNPPDTNSNHTDALSERVEEGRVGEVPAATSNGNSNGNDTEFRSASRSSFNSAFSNDGGDPDAADIARMQRKMQELVDAE